MNVPPATHPTNQTLNDYGLGKLDDSSSSAIESHLENCSDCRGRLSGPSSDTFLARLRAARKSAGRSVPGVTTPFDGTIGMIQARPSTPSPPATDSLPSGLADHTDYEIRRELGRGGMGVVYLAHNTMMGRDEVLKVMSRHLIERPGVLERFQREIRAVAQLRHPNIVAAYTTFRIEGGLVFAMEYVEGLDLARLVKAKGPLPVAHAAYFIHQAALGLQHALEKGMVHRDIKPHNLMLTHDGKARAVKLLDFGLAKASREEKVDSDLTSVGQALGTPDYIAPEQILDAASADIRADLYSLGGTLFYLLTGRPPFQAKSLYEMYQAHISRDAEPLNLLRPEVPAELAALVSKMMAKEPGRRIQTPGEVAQALLPFFKKANPPAQNREERRPQPIRTMHPQQVTVTVPTHAQTPVPERSAVYTIEATGSLENSDSWEGLIDLRASTDLRAHRSAVAPRQRSSWLPKPMRIAASFSGLMTLGVVIAMINGLEGRSGPTKFMHPDGSQKSTSSREVRLFNGKNLGGWRDLLPGGGMWKVNNQGILEGRGGGPGKSAILITQRQDFANFRLRAQVQYNEDGFGWIELRRGPADPTPSGYFVSDGIKSAQDLPVLGTVGNWTIDQDGGVANGWWNNTNSVNRVANKWYTIEITVLGNRIETWIDGTKVDAYVDKDRKFRKGRIALVCEGNSAVQFQDVVIEILPDND